MDQKTTTTSHFVVSYRVLAQVDGQPDFMEAFTTLNKVAGDEGWSPLSRQPDFEAKTIGGETYYLMPIFVATDLLNLLKFYDVIQNVLRVFEERRASQADYDAVLTLRYPA